MGRDDTEIRAWAEGEDERRNGSQPVWDISDARHSLSRAQWRSTILRLVSIKSGQPTEAPLRLDGMASFAPAFGIC